VIAERASSFGLVSASRPPCIPALFESLSRLASKGLVNGPAVWLRTLLPCPALIYLDI
jgi:hypothetical protein